MTACKHSYQHWYGHEHPSAKSAPGISINKDSACASNQHRHGVMHTLTRTVFAHVNLLMQHALYPIYKPCPSHAPVFQDGVRNVCNCMVSECAACVGHFPPRAHPLTPRPIYTLLHSFRPFTAYPLLGRLSLLLLLRHDLLTLPEVLCSCSGMENDMVRQQ